METNIRDLKPHLCEDLHRAVRSEEMLLPLRGKPLAQRVPAAAEDATIARLRALPWITAGNGNKPLGSAHPVHIGADEKNLAAIVSELRG